MNITIVGMGEVGRYVVRVLTSEGHSVTIIDSDPGALERAEEMFDARTIRGHAAHLPTLRTAEVDAADLFVAVTDHCEVNLLAAMRAQAIGAKQTIARVLDGAYFEVERGLVHGMHGIDLVINPMYLVASEIRRLVRSQSALSVHDFADHQIEVVRLPVEMDAPIVGKPLKDLRLPEETLVAAILRGDEFIIPGGGDAILAGDEILWVSRTGEIAAIERLAGKRGKPFGRKAIVVGGGRIGQMVASALETDEFQVVVVERDVTRCRELSVRLDHSVVLHADGTNSAILEEEGVADADVFIAVSDEDELNLMASLLAKDLGARRCIALVHRPDYAHICDRVGIDTTLSPRLTVAEEVLKYVREGQVVALARVMEGRAELLEFVVPEDARIANKPLHAAEFPRGAIACAVLGESGARVPRGDDVVRPGDQVVVFTTPERREAVERLFRKPTISLGQ